MEEVTSGAQAAMMAPMVPGREKTEREHRRDIVLICQRIYAHGWLAATDGNVSVLMGGGRILATPTGVHKGYLSEADLIVIDRAGRKLNGTREPSSEIRMHLAAYDARPDVRAVVHAHPTNCIAFSLAGVSLAQCLLPEIVFTFGAIPTTAYTTPTTEEVPNEVTRWLGDYDAMILDRHGSLTVGADVYEAYDKLERMEHVAEITFRARQLGPIRPLSAEQVAHLQDVGSALGLAPRKLEASPCERCNACPGRARAPGSASRATGANDAMIARVGDEVARALRGK